MRRILACCILVSACFSAISRAQGADRLICCGDRAVFVIPASPAAGKPPEILWRWTAADSPEIPKEHHPLFRTTDECKPYPEHILITASSGGIALVRRSDKRAVFWAQARNAHSACLLPGDRVAVAASLGGDEVQIFARGQSGVEAKPRARLALAGAHGVFWETERERLWALGTHELLRCTLTPANELTATDRWPLPTTGGHDLSPGQSGQTLLITTRSNVYQFDRAQGTFTLHPLLGGLPTIKSVDEHPRLKRLVYHQGAKPNWWSDTIRFAGPDETIRLEGERLYKVRWDR